MEELHKLENIATMLTGMFSSDISNQETPITTAGQTSEELLNELKTLQEETEQRVSSFGHKLNQLELMSYKSLDDAAESTIQEVMDLISDINKSKYIIKSSEQTAEELKNKISEKQLEESGFKNQEEVKSKSDELWTKRRGLRDKFAGKYRFKKDIRLIESEINKLNNLEYAAHNSIRISNLHYSDENKFEELQGQVFSKMVSDLFSEYRSLLANTIQPEKTEGKLKHEVLTSVTEDYITKKFKPEIEESLGLPSPELVDKALSILREGFKDGIYHDHNASEEEKKRKQLLNEKLQSLPYQIKDIVQFGITRGDKVVDDAFAEIGSFISQAPSESQRLKILNSFSRSSRLLLNVFDKTNLPYEISNKKWTLQEKKEDIEESYSLKEKRKQLMKIDMEKFDIFRNNDLVKETYSVENLEKFNQMIGDEAISRLLVTTEHTNESVNLGHKAIWFKDAKAIAYNILNFWREPGHSGEMPFLNIHTNSQYTLGAKYIMSLTEEQLKAAENLNIPGLIDIINQVKNNPKKFTQNQINQGEKWVTNPAYNKIEQGLGKMCGHFLENGTEDENYFSVSTATKLGFMRYKKNNSKLRNNLIDTLSERIGLDENVKANFKKHYKIFMDNINSKARNSQDFKDYKEDLDIYSEYFDQLDDLLPRCNNPNKVRKEAEAMQNDSNYIWEVKKDLPILIDYLEAFDSDIVQQCMKNRKYKDLYHTLLWKVKQNIFRESIEIDNVKDHTIKVFTDFNNSIKVTKDLISKLPSKKILISEWNRKLESMVYSMDVEEDTKHISTYYTALGELKTAERFNQKDTGFKNSLESLANITYDLSEQLVTPIIRETLRRDDLADQMGSIQNYLNTLKWFPGFVKKCEEIKDNPRRLIDTIYELTSMGSSSLELVEAVEDGKMDIGSIASTIKRLKNENFKPTSYLVKKLIKSADKSSTIESWLEITDTFEQGKFDSNDELHRNLEYTRFRRIVNHEKLRTHLKNHFTFDQYLSIFENQQPGEDPVIGDKDRFEIECVAEEAKVLRDYVLSIKEKADQLGREVFIVPNLSYGYLPVSPLTYELEEAGIQSIIGIKVGSTESHNNKEIINSRLFKGYRGKITNDQPILIVVDGTKHLLARDNNDKDARYPDAYQGYLNQVIAANDALGFTDEDYAAAGKTEEDMSNLRLTQEFQKLVDVYKHVLKSDDPQKERKPYQFGLWNTAGMNLIIRNYHQKLLEVSNPTAPEDIEGPALIYCNVGLLDNQIPDELKQKYEGLTHQPAHFDDSGKIIDFDFGFDNFGVRYLNTLETEVMKAYDGKGKKSQNGDLVSSFIRYIENQPEQAVECDYHQ